MVTKSERSYLIKKIFNTNPQLCFSILASVTAVLCLFLFQGSVGINLADEGFLWYGAQRVLAGEIPFMDFQSYDPGRYYWCALFMGIFSNDGIISLRFSVAVFQAIGLAVGVYLVFSSCKNNTKAFVLFALLILLLWMFPRHKLFDISLSILLIGVLTHLVRKPTFWSYGLAGLFVGLTATFGRNHGVYGIIGSVGVIAWLNIFPFTGKALFKNTTSWITGMMIGFLPILIMMVFITGFGSAFADSVLQLFELKATNISLPVPWPWEVEFNNIQVGNAIQEVLVGFFFIAILVFGAVSIVWICVIKARKKPIPHAVVAASCLSLPYAHYAFSRADVGHLALGIFPFLIGCIVLIGTLRPKPKWSLIVLLLTSSFWVMHSRHPGWKRITGNHIVDTVVYGSNLQINANKAHNIKWISDLFEQHVSTNGSILVTPSWPGAYAFLGQKSPVWEIYALWPRPPKFENAEIGRLKTSNPELLFVMEWALDGRDDLRFSNTHPLTYTYITDNYALFESSGPFQIYIPIETNK